MLLKLVERQDKEAVLDLIEEMFEYSAYSRMTPFDRSSVAEQFDNVLANEMRDTCGVLLKDGNRYVGLVVMGRAPFPGSFKEYIGTELVFWLREGYGTFSNRKALLTAFMEWSKQAGCKAVAIGKMKKRHAEEHYTIRKL